ncbi:MAG TPA: hypothetical protein VG712_02850, partial [Gemmatimonadales bacterium]|nr:hypothetical protein [Gemmatimonadales bacterium]
MALACLLAAIPATRSGATGIVPGLFGYRLHAGIPLLTVEGEFPPPYQRAPDAKALLEAPFAAQAGEPVDMSVTSALEVSEEEAGLDGSQVPEDIVTELPPGPILDLSDVPPCTQTEFTNTVSGSPGGCPAASQVGVVGMVFAGALPDRAFPLYKLAAGYGHLATLGFPYVLIGSRVGIKLDADLRAGGDYGITLSSTQTTLTKFVPAPFITIWGVPADPAHDTERWDPTTGQWGESLGGPALPLVWNATDCDAGVREARARLRYWSAPGSWLPEDPDDPAYRSFAPAPEGCEKLGFEPRAELQPQRGDAGSPTGIDLRLELPRSHNGLATPPLRSATLTLPPGMAVNPASADGLIGCPPGDGTAPAPCPAGSRIGTATVRTPIAEAPLTGGLYLATPFRNPFGSPLALYLVLDGPGFTAKLPVRVEAEPGSGRLSASLQALPPLPLDSVELELFGGPRAPLVSPPGCGEGTVGLQLTPVSAPQSGPPAQLSARYAYSSGAGGGECPPAPGQPQGALRLRAGMRDAGANGSSPFVLDLSGGELGGLEVGLPAGLSLNARGVGRCGEDELERARSREVPGGGAAERDDPSCPAGARVGSVLVAAGTGSSQLWLRGDAYLAGPYQGAPLSLVTIVPVLAGGSGEGPLFDLGTVVERVGLAVDRRSGAISARAAAAPPALDGIPLRPGAMRLVLDRPGFVRAPSGCGNKQVSVVVEDAAGARMALRSGFRASGCSRLSFSPRLGLTAIGGGPHPGVRAVLRAKAAEAGIAAVRVTLGAGERLDPRRLRSGAVLGHASAWSALLDRPLEGPVRLRLPRRGPPELVLALAGGPEMEVTGQVRRAGGRVRIDFPQLPDVQLTKLALDLSGGSRGLLIHTGGSCGAAAEVAVRLASQAGAVRSWRTPVRGLCRHAGGRSARHRQTANRTEG